MVEIFSDGCGRRGGKLRSCTSVPVYNSDQYPGENKRINYSLTYQKKIIINY